MKMFFLILLQAMIVGCSPFIHLNEFPAAPPNNGKDSTEVTPDVTPDKDDDIPPSEWETANEVIANIGVGWNLGNTLDAHGDNGHDGSDWQYWETYWGQPVTTQETITMMKDAGYGAIRVPVTWDIHMTEDGTVSEAWMNRVHEVVDYVMNTGMYCIVNVHHDTGAGEEAWLIASSEVYEKQKARYEYLWKQIAEEFKDYGHRLLFESYNEMLDARRSWCYASFNDGYNEAFAMDAYDAINNYAQSFVNTVRATGGNNSVRNLIVNTYGACSGVGNWSQYLQDPLKYMKLPEDKVENHLIFEVHAYPTIDNMNAMPQETEDLFAGLDRHLASKGAPVIMGEWGTFSENPPLEDMLEFADCFVKTARKYNVATFYWMGLTDGIARKYPAFSHPELAKTIVAAYHGSSAGFKYPTVDDFLSEYKITYESQWAEINLCSKTISTDDYSGIAFELVDQPSDGELMVKIYGDEEGKEYYMGFSGKTPVINFSDRDAGKSMSRITLQYMNNPPYSITLKNVELIRHDGTREKQNNVSVFWGCSIELISQPK